MPKLYYREHSNSIPSQSSLWLWLNTRKSGNPGLFRTDYFLLDSVSFIVVIILELLGLWQLYSFAGISILQMLFLFAIDFGLVAIKHFPVQQKICLCKNELVIYRGHPDATAILKSKKKRYKFWKVLWSVPIVLIAFFKTEGFLSAVGSSGPQGVIMGIVATYVAVAILHILSSGYFMAESLTKIYFWKDFQSYQKGDSENKVSTYVDSTINYSQTALNVPCKCASPSHLVEILDQHSVKDDELEIKWDEYRIRSWSILDDDHLNKEIKSMQNSDDQKTFLERYIIKHQVNYILNKSLLSTELKKECHENEEKRAKEALADRAKINTHDESEKKAVYKKVCQLLNIDFEDKRI